VAGVSTRCGGGHGLGEAEGRHAEVAEASREGRPPPRLQLRHSARVGCQPRDGFAALGALAALAVLAQVAHHPVREGLSSGVYGLGMPHAVHLALRRHAVEAEDCAHARRLGVRLEEVEHELLPRRRTRLIHQVQRRLHVGTEGGAGQRVVAHHTEETEVLLRSAAPLGQRPDLQVRVLPRLLVPGALLALARRCRPRRRARCEAGGVGRAAAGEAFLGDGGLERVVWTPRPGDMERRVCRRTSRWEHEPEAVLTRLRIGISFKQAGNDPHRVPFLDRFVRAVMPHAPHPHLEAPPVARHHDSAWRALEHDLQQRQPLVRIDEGVA
jgi:hypothetical protein